MAVVINGDTGISPVTASGTSASVDGMTVGRGGGELSLNTAVGLSALNSNTTGNQQVAIGRIALRDNTTGTENTAVGAGAMPLNISGNYNSALGNGALNANTTGSNNVSVGYSSLGFNTTASNNTAVGYQAGYSFASTGTAAVTAFGYQAAYTINAADPRITAIGYQALYTNNGGSSENTAVGWGAAKFTTTGAGLVAMGNESLSANTTGSSNTAIGYQSLTANTTGIENTAIGYRALTANTTASYNTAVGRYALYLTTTGTHNTCIGHNSGYNISTGTKNTILGRYDGNQGGLDIRTASNYIVLSDGDGNPNAFCDNNGKWTIGVGGTTNSSTGTIKFNGASGSGLGWFIDGLNNGTRTNLIGNYSQINGGTATWLTLTNTSGGVYLNGASATSWTAVSDETRKIIIEPITDAANKVSTLRAVIGRLKTDNESVRRPYLIAQDVQAVLPEAVSEAEDKEGAVLGLSYTEVIPLLVASIKELKTIVDAQAAEIAELKAR